MQDALFKNVMGKDWSTWWTRSKEFHLQKLFLFSMVHPCILSSRRTRLWFCPHTHCLFSLATWKNYHPGALRHQINQPSSQDIFWWQSQRVILQLGANQCLTSQKRGHCFSKNMGEATMEDLGMRELKNFYWI